MLDQVERRIAQLGRVMRRDCGGHADRNALGAVSEKIRKRAGQHHRLFLGAVIGRAKIDRVLVDPLDQKTGHFGEARLGVAHRRRIIAVDIAEIALPVDQRVALGEVLREPHQRVVDRLIAMGMEFADDIAHHTSAFLERGARIEPQQAHRIKQTPVHRLEAVARIRQRAVHDGGERIGEIALLKRITQGDFLHIGRIGNQGRTHEDSIANAERADNLVGWAKAPGIAPAVCDGLSRRAHQRRRWCARRDRPSLILQAMPSAFTHPTLPPPQRR
jgi:hypothetical protein